MTLTWDNEKCTFFVNGKELTTKKVSGPVTCEDCALYSEDYGECLGEQCLTQLGFTVKEHGCPLGRWSNRVFVFYKDPTKEQPTKEQPKKKRHR